MKLGAGEGKGRWRESEEEDAKAGAEEERPCLCQLPFTRRKKARSTWEPPSMHHGGTSLANRKCYSGDGQTDQEMGLCGRQDAPSPSHRIPHEASAVVCLSVDIKSSFQDGERAGGGSEG